MPLFDSYYVFVDRKKDLFIVDDIDEILPAYTYSNDLRAAKTFTTQGEAFTWKTARIDLTGSWELMIVQSTPR